MKVKEIVYMVLDMVKGMSDDFTYTEDHVMFLLKKYRSFLIKKEQDKDKATDDSPSEFEETQMICLDLEEAPTLDGEPCGEQEYLKSVQQIPKILEGNQPRLFPINFYQGINVCFIGRDRMRYVGTNKYLQNIIYASLGPDKHLYMTSSNPQFMNLEKIRMSTVFEDFDEAAGLLCDDDGCSQVCDPLDADFPIKDYMVPPLLELVVKELTGAAYRPKDENNNAADDLSKVRVQS